MNSWQGKVASQAGTKSAASAEPLADAMSERRSMAKRYVLGFGLFVGLFLGPGAWTAAQDDSAQIRVNVNLVQLNVAVTDQQGKLRYWPSSPGLHDYGGSDSGEDRDL